MKVILIEDDEQDRHLIAAQIGEVGPAIQIVEATGLDDAKSVIAKDAPEVALLDLGLGPTVGLRTLFTFQRLFPKLPVVVMTGLDDADTGLEAIHRGAKHYLVKGRDEGDSIVKALHSASGVEPVRHGGMKIFESDDLNGELRDRIAAGKSSNVPIVVATVQTPASVLIARYGDENMFYIDGSGHNQGHDHSRVSYVESPQRFETLAKRLEFACRRLGPNSKAVLYTLDTLGLYASAGQVAEFVHSLTNRVIGMGIDLEIIAKRDSPLLSHMTVA